MPAPTALKCPSCSSPFEESAFDLDHGLVRCQYCGTLTTLPSTVRRPQGLIERGPLALPKQMSIEPTAHGMRLVRKWFSPVVFFLIPFCVVWNGFLIFWYVAAFSTGAPMVATLFPLIHVAVGVGLAYFTLALLINRTEIAVERGEVVITHAPLPWFGYRRIPGVMIDQIYAKVHITHGKNGPSTDYQLWLVNTSGKHEKLHANNLSQEQALYIEQQLEKALGIKDRAISGELPRM
jgi:hypothetical protein